MSCCANPKVSLLWPTRERDGWAIHSKCSTCKMHRRETVLYATRDEARHQMFKVWSSLAPRGLV